MKTQIKKLIALVACLCLLLPMSVYLASASGNELTIAEAIAMGSAREHNDFTVDKYYVTGVITEVYQTTYGNMRITDSEGNILTAYGTFSADGALRYDAMDVKPVVGDTVKLYGVIGHYNGTPQIKNSWIVEHTPAENGGEQPVAPEVTLVDAPVAGTAYKFGMIQENVSADTIYYLDGNMSKFYMATTTSVDSAIDVYLEETAGGYYLYTLNGDAKTYINMVLSADGLHVNGAYESTAKTVYIYDGQDDTIVSDVDGSDYWFGTRNDKTYTTVGPCNTEYQGFYCQFYSVKESAPIIPEPDVPSDPSAPTWVVAETLEAGVAYKLGLDQTAKGEVYYFIGEMSGFYGATQTDVALAVDMYVEIVEGGYYLYFNDANGAKQYIQLVQSGTHYNFTFGAEGSVFTLDAEKNALSAPCGDKICYMGTYGNFVTVGTLTTDRLKDSDYIARLYAQVATEGGDDNGDEPSNPSNPGTPSTPSEPDVPSNNDPAADTELSIPEANELGLSKGQNSYTDGKYYVTGKIAGINSSVYGNMYIVDEDGNQLYIYGTYSADGELRYDEMEYCPVAGDTVTIYGVIGTYNGIEAQMKNGWITNVIKGEGVENTDPEADSLLTIQDAIELGLSKFHNVFTEDKYYVYGQITEIYNDIFGNMYIQDADGNILTVYGTYDATGELRFDGMETQPQVGDYVHLYGIIGQYGGNAQMKNGWIIAINPAENPYDSEDGNGGNGGNIGGGDNSGDDIIIDNGGDDIIIDNSGDLDDEIIDNGGNTDGDEDIDNGGNTDGDENIDGDENAEPDDGDEEIDADQGENNGDIQDDTDKMGENVTGTVIAVILLVVAIAGVIIFNKKRA